MADHKYVLTGIPLPAEPWLYSERFLLALDAAARMHAAQRRKGSEIPYVSHLLGTCSIALEYGADEDEAIAALLHDAIEDVQPTGAARNAVAIFGDRVLAIVEGCTDADTHPKPPWRDRKERYIAHLAEADASILLVSAADKLRFELVIEDPAGGPPVIVGGKIDRIDRLPSGGIEVIDYKTGNLSSQKDVAESLQLSIYALACRDALGLGTPERVSLYFTESATRMSTTRTDEQLDAARADILARTARIRSGDFAATPAPEACRWCDYARLCPSRV